MALAPSSSQLERQALKEAVDRLLGESLRELFAELLEEVRSQGARSSGFLNPHSVPVGTNPSLILEPNPRRIAILLYNDGSATVYVGGRSVTTGPIGDPNAGLPLPASAPGWQRFERHSGEVWAVAGTGGPYDLRLLELLRDSPGMGDESGG